MNIQEKHSFETLIKNGEYAEAEKHLNEFIELHPEDREAKMLFGTCRMLQGDTETAKKIHDELEPEFSQNPDLPEPEKASGRNITAGSFTALRQL